MFKNSIAAGKYKVLYGGFKSFSTDELLKFIRNKFKNISFSENKDHFYIPEDDYVCIINDLPHSAGGYSVIKIKLR